MAMILLQCGRCNYKFERKAIPKKCPYCDKDGHVTKAQSAQDILDEAVSDFDQFDEERKTRQK